MIMFMFIIVIVWMAMTVVDMIVALVSFDALVRLETAPRLFANLAKSKDPIPSSGVPTFRIPLDGNP